MRVETETLVVMSAFGGRILRVPGDCLFGDSTDMLEIHNDLSPVERATLHRILKCERLNQKLELTDKEITALALIKERIQKKGKQSRLCRWNSKRSLTARQGRLR